MASPSKGTTARGQAKRAVNITQTTMSRLRAQRKADIPKKQAFSDYYDYNLLACVLLLTCFGLVMLYSTSAYESVANGASDMAYFGKQALISLVCFAAMLVASVVADYHWVAKFSGALYILALVLMLLTRFVGIEVNGARRWLGVGSFSFQPSELAKLAIILLLPSIISVLTTRERESRLVLFLLVFLGGLAGVFAWKFTENLSTALIIVGIAFIMSFVVARGWKTYFALIGAGGVALIIARLWIFPMIKETNENFRMRRILVWLDPTKYSDGIGYQITQALYALGSGGLFGKGLGNSAQKLGALPEAQNDMIFSIICEELGVFGAGIVIILFVFLLYRLFFIAQNAPDLMGSLIAVGVFAHIALQVVLNIAVVTNTIPTTGITLPFVSYGGTSVLFLMAEMAIVLNISRQITFK